jgi:Tfp pilus assembly protein PilN
MQQINLYQYLQKPDRSPLSAKTVLLSYGLFLLLLLICYFYGLIQAHHQAVAFNQATSDLNQSRQHLVTLVEKYPQFNLDSQILNANQACQVRFSRYLTGLASVAVPGVWLTEITISESMQLMLKGHALKAEAVQQYMNQLNSHHHFLGKDFALQELTEAEETKLLDFSVVTSDG